MSGIHVPIRTLAEQAFRLLKFSQKWHVFSLHSYSFESRYVMNDQADTANYIVLINDVGQYSLWPLTKETPLGWRHTEKRGSKEDCISYIKSAWKDMRPVSLIKSSEK